MEKIDSSQVKKVFNDTVFCENTVDAITKIQKEVLSKYNKFISENIGKPYMHVYFEPLFRDVENKIKKVFDGKISQRINFYEDGKYYEISLTKGTDSMVISTKIGR